MPSTEQAEATSWARTDEEIKAIVKELLGGASSVAIGQFPDIITTYKVEHGVAVLSPIVYDYLLQQSREHPDIALDEDGIVFLLKASAESSQPLDSAANTTPSRRRVSDRVKSPSDSSDTSDEDVRRTEHDVRSGSPTPEGNRGHRAQSEDAHVQRKASTSLMSSASSGGARRSFPPSSYALPIAESSSGSSGARHAQAGSESQSRPGSAPKDESPLAARMRSEQGGPSYGVMGFAKPSALPNRRRVSRDISGRSVDNVGPSDVAAAAKYRRSISMSSDASSRARPDSPAPTSPMLDDTSFHVGIKSPPNNLDIADDSFLNGDHSEEPDPFDLHDSRLLSGDLRISKLSTASNGSLNSQLDQMQDLKRQIAELERKHKLAEQAVQALGQENDQVLSDMQDKLDEAYDELALRKKEQFEYKGKDRAHTVLVKNLELEIDVLKTQLQETRDGQGDVLKRHQQMIENTSKLSDELLAKEREISQLMKQNEGCDNEIIRLQSQITAFEEQLKRQQEDFEQGEMAKNELLKQKTINLDLIQENESLKRQSIASALSPEMFSDGVIPGGSAGPSTMGRNLGAEFARQMDGDDDDDEPTVVERTITTRVTRRNARHSRKSSDVFEPVQESMEEVCDYVEVGTDPDPPPMLPPAYTPTDEPPVSPREILHQAHPLREGSVGSLSEEDEDYRSLVKSIGIRCKMYEEKLQRKRATDGPSKLPRKRSQTFSGPSANERGEGVIGYMRESPYLATGVAFACGLFVGGMWLAGSGPSRGDIDLFTKMNTLAMAAGGVGEGVFPPAMMMNALDQGARRLFVPT